MRSTTSSVRVRAVVWVVALATGALSLTGIAPASARTDITHKIANASDDLAAASKAVTKAAEALASAKVALPAAEAALAAASTKLATAQRTAAAAAAQQKRAEAAYATAQKRLADAKARIADMNLQIGALARAVYTQGPYTELAAILTASTPSDFADQLEAVRAVSRSQNRTLVDLEAAKADLALATAQADQTRGLAADSAKAAAAALASASTLAKRAAAARAKVAAIVAARAAALRVAAREKRKVRAQYLALLKEQRRLAALDRRGGGFTGVPSGDLIWPIPGASLVGGVGWRVHPVYGYKSCHTGDDIRGTYGTPILSAADGKVVDVISSGAYGLHTVISHGNGISTMYAHQSGTTVHVGEIVRQGQVIGYVGSSGWVTGPHLHFEIHVGGVPYDPLGWFGSARVPVPCWAG